MGLVMMWLLSMPIASGKINSRMWYKCTLNPPHTIICGRDNLYIVESSHVEAANIVLSCIQVIYQRSLFSLLSIESSRIVRMIPELLSLCIHVSRCKHCLPFLLHLKLPEYKTSEPGVSSHPVQFIRHAKVTSARKTFCSALELSRSGWSICNSKSCLQLKMFQGFFCYSSVESMNYFTYVLAHMSLQKIKGKGENPPC